MEPAEALSARLDRQAGVFTVAQAVSCLGRHAVAWRLQSRRWQRRHPRVLVAQSGPLTVEQEHWAAVLHCGAGAVLGRETAAALCGLKGHEDRRIHVVVPAHRQPMPAAGLVVARSERLTAADLVPGRLPPRTGIERSVLDAAAAARRPDRSAALLLAAVQQGLTRADRLQTVLDRLPKQRRRSLLHDVLADAAGGIHSLPEREFARLVRRKGLPPPSHQVVRCPDGTGKRRYLDVAWDKYATRVEIDGIAHLEVVQSWADFQRDNELELVDDARSLRFPAYAVRHHPERVADLVERALRLGGWLAGPM